MADFLLWIVGTIGVFAGTNVDDIVILTVLFLESRASGQPKAWQIWAGQYLGIAALVVMSGLAALGLTSLPDTWVGWIGVVPIALGIRGLMSAVRHRGQRGARAELSTAEHSAIEHSATEPAPAERSPAVASGVLSVAALTVANGADNVSVYTPMFVTLDVAQSLVALAVFASMTALWCIAGSWLGSHKAVIALVERSGDWIVPGLFILIGSILLIESGVLTRLVAAP